MDIASLPPDLEQFVQNQVATGKYGSPSEVLCDAVRVLKERQMRLESLRKDIEEGIKQLDSGEFIEIESEAGLQEFFDDIQARSMQRLSAERSE